MKTPRDENGLINKFLPTSIPHQIILFLSLKMKLISIYKNKKKDKTSKKKFRRNTTTKLCCRNIFSSSLLLLFCNKLRSAFSMYETRGGENKGDEMKKLFLKSLACINIAMGDNSCFRLYLPAHAVGTYAS